MAWSAWSSGPRCGGCISFGGCRSGRSRGATGSTARRSGGRCGRDRPPRYERARRPSKLDPFKDEIHRLLRGDPRADGSADSRADRPHGFEGGKTIIDDYLREVRPLFRSAADLPADRLQARGDLPVRSLAADGAGSRSATARRAGLGGGRLPRLLARRRRRAGVLQAGAGRALGDGPLPVVARCAAGAGRLGPRGRPARGRRAPERRVRRLLRPAAVGWHSAPGAT